MSKQAEVIEIAANEVRDIVEFVTLDELSLALVGGGEAVVAV